MGNFILYLTIGFFLGLVLGFLADFRRLVFRSLVDASGD